MNVGENFQQFLVNLGVDNSETITFRYGEITACLNKKFRDTESKVDNCLQVGSYGRWTAIKGVSDLDMLYIMPKSKWDDYKEGRQYQLLLDTKNAIADRYPKTDVSVDRLVVRVLYKNFHVEVQPVFEEEDGSFKYPDSYNGGSWQITKPREEIREVSEQDGKKNKNLRRLCRMTRAWKNKHGVGMGGLLVDTLAHNFLLSTATYDNRSYGYYDELSRDFFKYLSDLPEQDWYAAVGSGQRVKVKKSFKKKAKKAYELSLEAIEGANKDNANAKWKKIYGRPFPAAEAKQEAVARTWANTEEFIEDKFPVDIQFNLKIECEVLQNGFRESLLSYMIAKGMPLRPQKRLRFYVEANDTPESYGVLWKVLNRGNEARVRDSIRGQIVSDKGKKDLIEHTSFMGQHIVECYIVKNGVVVAKDRIDVPIS